MSLYAGSLRFMCMLLDAVLGKVRRGGWVVLSQGHENDLKSFLGRNFVEAQAGLHE